MPSPFPGMDPFIESQKWLDFHTSLLLALRQALVPLVRPRYVVEVEKHIYLARDFESKESVVKSDVALFRSDAAWPRTSVEPMPSGVTLAPVALQTPVPDSFEQTFLEIHTRDGAEVVTTIEVLSPWNKAPGAGHTEYLTKRMNVFATSANLVEIDLLRAGTRLPTTMPLPRGDYFAFVTHGRSFPDLEVFAWSLREPLPRLPIPLAAGDADVVIDLQAALDRIYDEAGYDYSINYQAEIAPRLSAEESQWVAGILANMKRGN